MLPFILRMMNMREFTKGEKYRPIVTVEKTKNGKPTVLKVSGLRYILDHPYAMKRKKG